VITSDARPSAEVREGSVEEAQAVLALLVSLRVRLTIAIAEAHPGWWIASAFKAEAQAVRSMG